MLTYSKTQKLRIAVFLLALLLAVSTTLPPFRFLHSPGTFIYMGLVLAWALTVQRRIPHRQIRRLLLFCCAFMVLIFVLRLCRYDLFREMSLVSEYMLYLYGVCYTMAALLSFLAALCTGRGEKEVRPGIPAVLWLMEAALCALMLTNPLHGLFYVFIPDSLSIQSHGPVYILMAAWCAVLAIATIVLLLIRCRNSFTRRYWFLPAAGFAAGAALLVWYFAAGGAPQIRRIKLFNLQEAFCLTVILPFEAIFRIGLIATNSDYELFFRQSVIKAAILDENGNAAIVSPSYNPRPEKGERLRKALIPGGSVVWYEDIGELLRLRDELTVLNEELDAENELIREENRLLEEHITLETRNRLYDSISEALEPQIKAMQTLMDEDSPAEFRPRLKRALVLGVYIKRMGNLMLLGDGKKTLPLGELALSLSESLEYLELAGIACELRCSSEEDQPTGQLLLCYRIFQHLIDANYDDLHACRLELAPEKDILMRVTLDSRELRGAEDPGLLSVLAVQKLRPEKAWKDEAWLLSLRRSEEPEEKEVEA